MTVPTRTYHKLSIYQKRIAAMLDDPDCYGDLLALGIALLDYAILKVPVEPEPEPEQDPNVVHLPSKKPKTTGARKWSYYAERAWGPRPANHWHLKSVLKKDIRRYDAIKDAESNSPASRCGAPMIRREGPCGNSAGIRGMVTDPSTGRKQWLAACSRHRDWFNERVAANRAALGEVEELAIPAANAGGVLARHITEIDWEHLWKQLDPEWVAPPEGSDEPTESIAKPKLRLILGGV